MTISNDENSIDDYARTRVPEHAKRGAGSILSILIGIITAFFFILLGGLFVHRSGAVSTWIALVISFFLLTSLCLIIAKTASKEGLTSELITRGCGFGSIGSVFTTVIYAGTFVIYCGLEGQILASSIDQIWDLPDPVWYFVVALIFIPMIWNGINSMVKILFWTIPIYISLLVWAIVVAYNKNGGFPTELFTAMPEGAVGGVVGVLAVMAGLAGTIGINPFEAADYNRFIRASEFKRKALISVVLPYAMLFFVAIPLGMYFSLITKSTSPSIYFIGLIGLIPGVLLAWVAQIRINLTNIHIGSVAYTSGSEALGFKSLGRRFWAVVITGLSFLLMLFDVLGNIYTYLEWTGIFLLSWLACVIADIVIVRGLLKIVSGPIEYRSEYIRKINPVGVSGLFMGTLSASLIWMFVENPVVNGLSAYIGFTVAFSTHICVAYVTKGKTYVLDEKKHINIIVEGNQNA